MTSSWGTMTASCPLLFALHPPCEQRMVIPMDTRLLKMLVFLFEVEKMYDPPHHAL